MRLIVQVIELFTVEFDDFGGRGLRENVVLSVHEHVEVSKDVLLVNQSGYFMPRFLTQFSTINSCEILLFRARLSLVLISSRVALEKWSEYLILYTLTQDEGRGN